MSTVGEREIRTQKQVLSFLDKSLGYRYLGNWKDRPNNKNVEDDMLRAWLKNQGHNDNIISKVLRQIDQAKTISGSKTLYQANQEMYRILRYGVKIKPSVSEQYTTVWLLDWNLPLNNDFAVGEEVSITGVHGKRSDTVLYVNGIAIGVLELKRSTVSVTEGIRQNLDNQKRDFIRPFFSTVQLVMAGMERVEVDVLDTDRYGRKVALVYIEGDGECLNEELIRAGYAWVYEQYCHIQDCDQWRKLERRARRADKGLWVQDDPIPPWEWRQGDRGSVANASEEDKDCSDFRTQTQAQRFFKKHQPEDHHRLDGDGDGGGLWGGCRE